MDASRHVTYQPRADWIPYPDLLAMTLGERIKYVRNNLADADGRVPTQSAFAEAIGKSGHHGVLAWEKGREPQPDARENIAELTPYPARAFSLDPGAGVSLATLDARLEELEALVRDAVSLTNEALRLLREAQQPGRAARRPRPPATGTAG